MLFKKQSRYKKNAGSISLIIILVIAAIVVVGGGAFVISGAASKFVHSTFDSPQKYLSYVVKDDLMGKGSSSAASVVDKIGDTVLSSDTAMEEEITITIGERGDKYLGLLKAQGLNLSWLENAGVKYSVNAKDDLAEIKLKLTVNGKDIASPSVIFDSKKYDLYFQIPEVSKETAKISLEEYADRFAEAFEKIEQMRDAFPDTKQVKKLMSKYLDIVLKQLDTVEKEKNATLNVKGVSQNCTKLRVTIKEKQIKNVIKAVCEEVAKDKELKKIFVEYLDSTGMSDYGVDPDEYWDKMLERLEEVEDRIEDYELGLDKITLDLYLDGSGNVIGRVLTIVPEDDVKVTAKIVCATSKKDVGFEASVEVEEHKVGIEGTGKLKGSKLTGEYALKYDGAKILKFDVENFDVKAYQDGNLKGHFTCSLDDDLMDLMDSDLIYELPRDVRSMVRSIAQIGSSIDPGIDFIVDIQDKKHSIDIGIMDGDEDVFRIAFNGKIKNASKVKLPSKVVNLEDEDEIEEFFSDLSWDNILDALDDAGVPSSLLNQFH